VSKLGCSTRLLVIIGIILFALAFASAAMGPLGSKVLEIHKPHVELPSEAMFTVLGFKITNTYISSWITIILLLVVFFFATRKMKLVPGRLQSFAEILVDGAYGQIQGVAGEKHARTFFPIVTTIFLYVVTNALLALIPIWGTWGPVEHTAEGTVIVPFLRAANTDINLTLSIALISFCFIEYLGFSRIGPLHYIDSFFQFSAIGKAAKEKKWGSVFGFGIINIFVGLLEIVSHLIRIISFTFRLFGNMTAGEILIGVITFLVALVVPSVFYMFETLFGLLQAVIFAGLTLVFGVMAVTPHSEEGAEH